MTTQTITVLPLQPHIAADIEGLDLSQPLSAEHYAQVSKAWREHLVLRFRGQTTLDAQGLIKFSSHFGKLDSKPIATQNRAVLEGTNFPEITTISNIMVNGQSVGGLGSYEAVWHTDMTYITAPPKGACLLAKEVPPTGGNTHFLNMYYAYQTLPEKTKNKIKHLNCLHDASRNSAGELRMGFRDTSDPRETVGAVHPLVRKHPETQQPCLFLGRRRNAYIIGLSLTDSEALLDELWEHAIHCEATWAQQWQVGDVVMWDNRCTMHRRDSFDAEQRRLMLRTQISGEPVLSA